MHKHPFFHLLAENIHLAWLKRNEFIMNECELLSTEHKQSKQSYFAFINFPWNSRNKIEIGDALLSIIQCKCST